MNRGNYCAPRNEMGNGIFVEITILGLAIGENFAKRRTLSNDTRANLNPNL